MNGAFSIRIRLSAAMLAIGLLALAAPAPLVLRAQDVTVTRGPYLQLGTSSSIVIRWRTSTAVVGRVQYGVSVGANTWEVVESAAVTDHKLELIGLLPDTTYYYSVDTTTATLAGADSSFRFTTAPPAGTAKSTRIWVLGDSGTANSYARAVRDAYYRYTGTRATDVWLMLGDNAYNNGSDSEYQTAVFDTYATMLRRTPLWPALGSHDLYSSNSFTQTGPFFDMFTLPKNAEAGGLASGTESYYSFDYGTIHLICLDSAGSSRRAGSRMLTWLANDLAGTNQPWVIVFFHDPPYSKASHDSDVEVESIDMRENVVPFLRTRVWTSCSPGTAIRTSAHFSSTATTGCRPRSRTR